MLDLTVTNFSFLVNLNVTYPLCLFQRAIKWASCNFKIILSNFGVNKNYTYPSTLLQDAVNSNIEDELKSLIIF